jgi:hypothetical protein
MTLIVSAEQRVLMEPAEVGRPRRSNGRLHRGKNSAAQKHRAGVGRKRGMKQVELDAQPFENPDE